MCVLAFSIVVFVSEDKNKRFLLLFDLLEDASRRFKQFLLFNYSCYDKLNIQRICEFMVTIRFYTEAIMVPQFFRHLINSVRIIVGLLPNYSWCSNLPSLYICLYTTNKHIKQFNCFFYMVSNLRF